MTTNNMRSFDQRLMAAVRQLTADSTGGISPDEAITLMAVTERGSLDDVKINFPLAVNRLRQDGVLMSNPSGQLRLTSAGQRQMAELDAPVDQGPTLDRSLLV